MGNTSAQLLLLPQSGQGLSQGPREETEARATCHPQELCCVQCQQVTWVPEKREGLLSTDPPATPSLCQRKHFKSMMFVFSESFKSIVWGRNLAAEHTNFLRALWGKTQPGGTADWEPQVVYHTRLTGDKRNRTARCLSPQPAQSQVAVETWVTLSPGLGSKAHSAEPKEY